MVSSEFVARTNSPSGKPALHYNARLSTPENVVIPQLKLTSVYTYNIPQTGVILGASHKVHELVISVDLRRTKYSGDIFPRIFKRIECLHYDATVNLP